MDTTMVEAKTVKQSIEIEVSDFDYDPKTLTDIHADIAMRELVYGPLSLVPENENLRFW